MKSNLLTAALDVVFPEHCISCGIEKTELCQDCLATIPINTIPLKLHASPLHSLFYATSYQEELVQRAIKYFKYPPFAKELALPLGFLIISHLALLDKPSHPNTAVQLIRNSITQTHHSFLCPIPLSKKRLKWRGFNQAEKIAQSVSELSGIQLAPHILIRTKDTLPQADLPQAHRKAQMKDAFVATNNSSIKNATIFLVDDVYTTGATMEEAARALRKAGATRVFGIAVARG